MSCISRYANNKFITSFFLIVRKNSNVKVEATTKNALAHHRYIKKSISLQPVEDIFYFITDQLVDRLRSLVKKLHEVSKVGANGLLNILLIYSTQQGICSLTG